MKVVREEHDAHPVLNKFKPKKRDWLIGKFMSMLNNDSVAVGLLSKISSTFSNKYQLFFMR